MNRIIFTVIAVCLSLSLFVLTLQAQTENPTPVEPTTVGPTPVPPANAMQTHLVQSGENLTIIAEAFDVLVEDLMVVNNIRSSDILAVGQEILIPGGEGDEVATAYRTQLGDSVASVAARFNTNPLDVARVNRLVFPAYGGLDFNQPLAVISHTGTAVPQTITGQPHLVMPDETATIIAAKYGVSLADLSAANDLTLPAKVYPGQRLRIPGANDYQFLPGEWKKIEITPNPITQGSTVAIYVENFLDGQPTGEFAGQSLNFIPKENGFAALIGLDAFTATEDYLLSLGGAGSRPWTSFHQDVPVQAAGYIVQEINVPEELAPLLDPEIRQNEDDFLYKIYANNSGDPKWEGVFQVPVTGTVTARYGDGRSYNAGPVEIFHSGVDFDGTVGTTISAPAAGEVIFNDWLELRGQTVIVDHGFGVMTGYYHLSDTFVEVGDAVVAGQPLAAGGSTGLSTGPHLHWELRVMGVPVNGIPWTQQTFP
ncbi:MAG: peptidoglycan DD-metalloendopeptidase family protein [Anaerolineales bacterium]|nr:peptidoglycan DD-metalloendopeptidase family protein [Anaerolineales bacterium]